jgi:hypothetical protein
MMNFSLDTLIARQAKKDRNGGKKPGIEDTALRQSFRNTRLWYLTPGNPNPNTRPAKL